MYRNNATTVHKKMPLANCNDLSHVTQANSCYTCLVIAHLSLKSFSRYHHLPFPRQIPFYWKPSPAPPPPPPRRTCLIIISKLFFTAVPIPSSDACVSACVRACVCACVRVCVRACVVSVTFTITLTVCGRWAL